MNEEGPSVRDLDRGAVAFADADTLFFGTGEAERHRVDLSHVGWEGLRRCVAEALHRRANPDHVAFVTLPFSPLGIATVILPRIQYRLPRRELRLPDRAVPRGDVTVKALEDPKEWVATVEEGIRQLQYRRISKIVLSRRVRFHSDVPFSVAEAFSTLAKLYPNSYAFAIDRFVGASPELLVARQGSQVTTFPLAGTAPVEPDPRRDSLVVAALRASTKDLAEHRILRDALHEGLKPFCARLSVPPEPIVVSNVSVHHLASPISGMLDERQADILTLVHAVHPTPAVCGTPTGAAMALISELEPTDRGRYAGAVGWVGEKGDGAFAVSIRCAELRGTEAIAQVGCGIMPDSDPWHEYLESQWKLSPLREALVRV